MSDISPSDIDNLHSANLDIFSSFQYAASKTIKVLKEESTIIFAGSTLVFSRSRTALQSEKNMSVESRLKFRQPAQTLCPRSPK